MHGLFPHFTCLEISTKLVGKKYITDFKTSETKFCEAERCRSLQVLLYDEGLQHQNTEWLPAASMHRLIWSGDENQGKISWNNTRFHFRHNNGTLELNNTSLSCLNFNFLQKMETLYISRNGGMQCTCFTSPWLKSDGKENASCGRQAFGISRMVFLSTDLKCWWFLLFTSRTVWSCSSSEVDNLKLTSSTAALIGNLQERANKNACASSEKGCFRRFTQILPLAIH